MAEKQSYSFKKALLIFWGIVLSPLMVIGLGLLIAAFSDLPSLKELENPKSNQATEVLSADGELLGKYYTENRVNVNYDELSPYLTYALVGTEDERFFSHAGVDLYALGRVVKGIVTLNTSQGGGSTITQQLAKMLFSERPSNIFERVMQKFQEWIIAVQLEKQYTKQEIIALYLNKFDFINNAVGIKSASKIYFNTSPDSLKLHEAALLVGMAKNPALYNPLRREDLTLGRRNTVFAQMVRNGYLTVAEKDSLKELPMGLDVQKDSHINGPAPYFREVLRQEITTLLKKKNPVTEEFLVKKANGDSYNIYRDGLKIYTTIDSRLQEYAEFAVQEHLSKNLQDEFYKDLEGRKRWNKEKIAYDWRIDDVTARNLIKRAIKRTDRYRNALRAFNCKGCGKSKEDIEQFKEDSIPVMFDTPVKMSIFTYQGDVDTVMTPLDSMKYYKAFLRAGMVSLDPKSGKVRAWVGGVDYKHFKFDHVKQGKNQVGSTFKPFVYATAIREGLSPCMKVPNVLTCFDIPGQPRYCPRNSDGEYEGEVTLKYALATSMNNITAWVMKRYGPEAITKLARDMGITSKLDAVPSLCLGVADINLLEITAANAVFANRGVYVKPTVIDRIEDKNGNVIYQNIPEIKEALDERTSYIMLNMLKGVVDYGTGSRLRRNLPYGNLDFPIAGKTGTTQSNSDGWFIGITPELVTGVWVGGEERPIRFRSTRYGQGANMALPIFGYYIKKAANDPAIDMSKKDFQWELPKSDLPNLDCDDIDNAPAFDEENFGI